MPLNHFMTGKMSVNKKETLIRVSFLFRYRRVFCAYSSAVPTGFEPAISALTGPHVKPLHHGTN
jgi:hypothetical protein